jgi:hypothetical protein
MFIISHCNVVIGYQVINKANRTQKAETRNLDAVRNTISGATVLGGLEVSVLAN